MQYHFRTQFLCLYYTRFHRLMQYREETLTTNQFSLGLLRFFPRKAFFRVILILYYTLGGMDS